MIRIQFFLIFLLLPLTMRSQEDICIGKRYSLYSAFLQEERDYWIYLPQNYDRDTTQNYPVIYLLDGGSFFHSLVGISQTLSTVKGKYLTPQRSCQPAETPLRTRRTHCGTGSRGRRRHQRSLSPCIARWPQSLPQGTCKRCTPTSSRQKPPARRTEASRPARTRSTRLAAATTCC